jgi:peptide/nickel transport system permease protein
VIGLAIGFTAGYCGGIVDEILSMFTNIVLVIPVFAVLLIVAAYLPPSQRGYVSEALLIGAFSWPWVARATRAQTFSLASREFVSLARLSGARSWQIIVREIAPNMSSYLVLVLILLFGGSILFAATLDFLGLGAPNEISLGQMLFNAQNQAAITRGFWWWFIPPGLAVTILVGALYVANVGLDEVFNPKLRET